MQIIPVIDLLNGTVVHARKGERHRYQAIQSLLTHSSKPLDIVAALLEYFPFRQLYIADLDAIQKHNDTDNNFHVIEAITKRYPNLKLWIDAGISNNKELDLWSNINASMILGTENFSTMQEYLTVKESIKTQCILSLDFMPHGYQGPIELIEATSHWPKDVIMMSLSHVGSGLGINTELLNKFKHHTGKTNLYAAGGVRTIDDLNFLKQQGIHGALIATALHQKQIAPRQIASLSQ